VLPILQCLEFNSHLGATLKNFAENKILKGLMLFMQSFTGHGGS
jgi:hypothetical protein